MLERLVSLAKHFIPIPVQAQDVHAQAKELLWNAEILVSVEAQP